MNTYTLYPYLPIAPGAKDNPYVHDFAAAIQSLPGGKVMNRPHKNPLLYILHPKRWGEVCVFNWFENIPDYKWGYLQACAAVILVCLLRLTGRKVVWMLHNRRPHAHGREWGKRLLTRFIARFSTHIVTHATDGIELVRTDYPFALSKAYFLHHPTKNRLPAADKAPTSKPYQLLVWGQISRYKGTDVLMHYLHTHRDLHLRCCIAGGCADEALYDELKRLAPPEVKLIRRNLSFEALETYIEQADFVLCPYRSESVFSSGILMDSLSMGAKVIGPHTGSFKDYATEPDLAVYTFETLDDLPRLLKTHQHQPIDRAGYERFLTVHDWPHFAQRLAALLG